MTLKTLIEANLSPTAPQMRDLGRKMFVLYSQHGYPPDMFLDRFSDLSLNDRIVIVDSYLHEMLEHKRTAGITEERVEKIRAHNRSLMDSFVKTGEINIY